MSRLHETVAGVAAEMRARAKASQYLDYEEDENERERWAARLEQALAEDYAEGDAEPPPEPDVCVWTWDTSEGSYFSACGEAIPGGRLLRQSQRCPMCDRPVKVKED